MPESPRPSRVTMTDQLNQRIVIAIYAPEQWESLPEFSRPFPARYTDDGRYVVTLSDEAEVPGSGST